MLAWAPKVPANSWIHVNFKSLWKEEKVQAKILNKQTSACGIAYRVAWCMDMCYVCSSRLSKSK